MKKTISYVFLGVVLFTTMAVGPSPKAAEKIILKAVSFQAKDNELTWGTKLFFNTVNERAKGQLSINFIGGPEVVGPREQFEAVRTGQVDIASAVTGGYRGTLPEASMIIMKKDSPWKARETGYYDLMVQLHKEWGIFYLGETIWTDPFLIWLKKPIAKLKDLAGLKIRTGPGEWSDALKALGAVPVSLSFSDIYSALEKGLVNGYYWPTLGVLTSGWTEVTKACLLPGVGGQNGVMLINLTAWNRLPKQFQDLMANAMIETEKKVAAYQEEKIQKEQSQLKSLGIQFIKLSPPEEKQYIETTESALWESFKKICRPEYFEKMRRLSQ